MTIMLESHHAHNPIIKIIDATHATGHWSLTYNLINTENHQSQPCRVSIMMFIKRLIMIG